nr:nuclear transport factor 2 family protein [Allomuricauda sp.]
MKKLNLAIIFLTISLFKISAQEGCLTTDNLKALDASWEKALLEVNLDFIRKNVSDNFIWVHNHAGQIDSKASLLQSGQKLVDNNTRNAKSRIQKDVNVIISGNTGIVTGFTEVVRINGTTRTTYNFMRTYAEIDGKCTLLANHTMAIPEKDDD